MFKKSLPEIFIVAEFRLFVVLTLAVYYYAKNNIFYG